MHSDPTHRLHVAAAVASGLRQFSATAPSSTALVGLDGFVDSIIDVVDKRMSREAYQPFNTIDALGHRILSASGESTNFELVVTRRKLGGNGPIMAHALASLGLRVTYVGALGHPRVDDVFKDLARAADCISIANPATTDALEFDDGKLMLGKLQTLEQVNWGRIDEIVGEKPFMQMVRSSQLVAMVNWTMLPAMDDIWQEMLKRFEASQEPSAGASWMFFDLADPSKRTGEDLRDALELIQRFGRHVAVVLGLNMSEAEQVARVLEVPVAAEADERPDELAAGIRGVLGVRCVVVHPRKGAGVATAEGQARFAGPFIQQPKISTGAGDHFNAGFCLGLLAGLDLEGCLCAGTACSGYYVRHAASPTLEQLAGFCDHLPSPE